VRVWKIIGAVTGWIAFLAAALNCVLRAPHP